MWPWKILLYFFKIIKANEIDVNDDVIIVYEYETFLRKWTVSNIHRRVWHKLRLRESFLIYEDLCEVTGRWIIEAPQLCTCKIQQKEQSSVLPVDCAQDSSGLHSPNVA